MADARRPKKADYKIQGQGTVSRDPHSRMAKKKIEARIEAVKAHQIPDTATVDDLVSALNERGAIGFIKTTELCNALVKQFGGLDEFAKEYKTVYDQTESGHLKARMFEGLVKLITGVNKTAGEEDPVDQMSDEDVERDLKRLFEKWRASKDGSPGANDGRGIPAVPQTDGGVVEKAERGPKPIPPPPEDGTIP